MDALGLASAFKPGQGDVRVVGSRLRNEAAWGRGRDDLLLEREQGRRDDHIGEEDTGPVEEVELTEADWDRRRLNGSEIRLKLGELLWRRFAEELQGDVPTCRRRPAPAVQHRPKMRDDALEFRAHAIVEWNPDEETHRRFSVRGRGAVPAG